MSAGGGDGASGQQRERQQHERQQHERRRRGRQRWSGRQRRGGGGSQAERAFVVYVGGHEGLFVFRLDDADGALSAVQGPLEAEMNPTFLAVDPTHQHLFAANELNEVDGELSGAVSAFRIDPQGGTLELVNRASSKGAGPAHLSTDRSGRFVLVANYAGGTAAVLPVGQDGALGQAAFDVSFGRRTRSHHAMTDPANRFAFVTNLGRDEITQLTFDADTGQMEPNDPPALSLPADTTPRHLEFHPNGRFAYVINESAGSITTPLSYDPSRGTFTALATVSTLPDGASAEETPPPRSRCPRRASSCTGRTAATTASPSSRSIPSGARSRPPAMPRRRA